MFICPGYPFSGKNPFWINFFDLYEIRFHTGKGYCVPGCGGRSGVADLAARKVDVSLRYGKSNMINYTISLISPRLPEALALKWHRLCNNKNMCI